VIKSFTVSIGGANSFVTELFSFECPKCLILVLKFCFSYCQFVLCPATAPSNLISSASLRLSCLESNTVNHRLLMCTTHVGNFFNYGRKTFNTNYFDNIANKM
jgi:hypothetical protein